MTTVDLEVERLNRSDLPIFLMETARSIEEGYGAGNCTPDSVAFWSLYPKAKIDPQKFLLRIELQADNLTDHEISAAVRKVTEAPNGEIILYGHKVGLWRIIEDINDISPTKAMKNN